MLNYLTVPIIAASMLLSGGVLAQSGGPSARGIDPDYPTTISNQNIWKMYTDYQVMLEEIDKSVTKKNAGLLSHDATRWLSYVTALRNYVAYWQSQEFLDFAVTHGRDWVLSDPLDLECKFKDNTSACELMALVISARDELVLSNSAGIPIHLYPADLVRQEKYWTAMEGYISFMANNQPLDEPVTAAEERLGLEPGFDKEPAQ